VLVFGATALGAREQVTAAARRISGVSDHNPAQKRISGVLMIVRGFEEKAGCRAEMGVDSLTDECKIALVRTWGGKTPPRTVGSSFAESEQA